MGLASYYRRFLPNFASIAAPLNHLTKKDTKFTTHEWTEECEKAFQLFKTALCEPPILSYPQKDAGTFILDTDASGVGIGAVLSQIQDGSEKVISYASKTLSDTEKRYCTTKRELYAVKYFVDYFRPYLYGRKIIIRTDHASLCWLTNFKNVDGMLARWLALLDTYDYDIQHRKGIDHTNADTLSRRPESKLICCPRGDCPDCKTYRVGPVRHHSKQSGQLPSWFEEKSLAEIGQIQDDDPDIQIVKAWVTNSTIKPTKDQYATENATVKAFMAQWENLEIHDNVLYRQWYPSNSNQVVLQLVAPPILCKDILQQIHSSRVGGHFGYMRTMRSLRARFYWPGYKADIQRWCRRCVPCARAKVGPRRKGAKLQPEKVGAPLEKVCIDIIGPLRTTDRGNSVIVVFEDQYTKWADAYALPNQQA